MKRYLKTQIARWWVVSLIAGITAISSLAFSSAPVWATACNIGIAFDASGGSASCDMSILAQVSSGAYTFSNDSSATIPDSPFTLVGTPILADFHFTSIVRDHLGNASGGQILASSSGLHNGAVTLPLSLTSLISRSCTNGACPLVVSFTSLSPVTTTPTPFITIGNHSAILDGDYTFETGGQFTIPAGSPSGIYSGVVTLTLTNGF
ncbi:MAG TPA: hypothetical protein VL485_23965 [Ktedonobacteraceae bacterium]|jgi:hypothetical protein|nr:hypothetical protein [Ktedonobacteraceae bacterium]